MRTNKRCSSYHNNPHVNVLKKILISTILVMALFSNLIEMGNPAEPLNLSISINKETFTPEETVIISGMVSDANNDGVSNAVISIQVNDPNNKMIHIAMVISGSDGRYVDQFIISSGQLHGQYTVFVTASKSGYPDTTMQTNYTVIPEFQIQNISTLIFIALFILMLFMKRGLKRP